MTRIFIHYEPRRFRQTTRALTSIADRWNINLQPSTFESRVFAVAVGPETKSETLFSVIAALVGFTFAFDAMLVTVPARRRLIADMRPHGIGATVTVLLIDAAVIGIGACRSGARRPAVDHPIQCYTWVSHVRFPDRQRPDRALVGGRARSWCRNGRVSVGVLWPMREPRDPEEQHESVLDRRRVRAALAATGLLCLAAATYTLIDDARAAVVGNIALVFALLCLLPLLFDAAVAIFARLSVILNDEASGTAAEELENPRTYVRYLAIAGTAALAVMGTVEFGGVQTELEPADSMPSRVVSTPAPSFGWCQAGNRACRQRCHLKR